MGFSTLAKDTGVSNPQGTGSPLGFLGRLLKEALLPKLGVWVFRWLRTKGSDDGDR